MTCSTTATGRRPGGAFECRFVSPEPWRGGAFDALEALDKGGVVLAAGRGPGVRAFAGGAALFRARGMSRFVVRAMAL